jgi:ferredoxin-like protein FixX
MWCGRISTHTNESVKALTHKLSTSTSKHNSHDHKKVEQTEIQRQADVMTTSPKGLYERFRRGLLEYHSEVCLHVRMELMIE